LPRRSSSFSLKWLSSPTTARRGVFAGELGMLLAIAGTLLHHGIVEYKWIVIGLVLGTIIGRAARRSRHDRRATTDGAESRVWRTLRDVGRHNEFYLRTPDVRAS